MATAEGIMDGDGGADANMDAWLGDHAVFFADEMASRGFGRGDLASLRRLRPDEPSAPAFWRLMASRGLLDGSGWRYDERKWGLILHGIALMTRNTGANAYRSAHLPNIQVGWALYTGGDSNRKRAYYSEMRLTRLLNARGVMRRRLLATMFRMMSAADARFNWQEMARFIYYGDDDGFSYGVGDAAKAAGDGIARAYYAAERRAGRAPEPERADES